MFDVRKLGWGGALALLLGAGVATAADEWKTVEDDPVVVKVRPRPGSKVEEVWAEVDVEADAYDIQTALMDTDSLRLWMPHVAESRRVSTREDGSRVAYVKLSLSPAGPRDCVMQAVDEEKVSEDGKGEYVQRWSTVEGEVPERSGVVRIKLNEGTWRVSPKGEGKAHIVYKASIDLGGALPKWLVNMNQKDGVIDTLKKLESRAKELGTERKAKVVPAGGGGQL